MDSVSPHTLLMTPGRARSQCCSRYGTSLSTGDVFACLFTMNAYASFQGNLDRCPNHPAWFVGAMLPSWLGYPLLAILLRGIARSGAWGYGALALLAFMVGYIPFLLLPKTGSPGPCGERCERREETAMELAACMQQHWEVSGTVSARGAFRDEFRLMRVK